MDRLDHLDREYNPRLSIPDHAEISARWEAASAAARSRISPPPRIDLRYGASAAETLDFFAVKSASPPPLLVFIHGGYWRARDKADFHFLAPAFVEAGVAVAMPNYGLAPALSLEEIVRQMLRAIAWLYREAKALNFDRRRIVVAGHSAGGHLAAMMAAAHWPSWQEDGEERLPADLLRGIVSVSGLHDLVPLARAPFLREDLKLDEAAARRVSPITYAANPKLSLVTAVGSEETQSFHEQTALLSAAWPECPHQDVQLPGRNHMSAVEALGEATHALFKTTLALFETVAAPA